MNSSRRHSDVSSIDPAAGWCRSGCVAWLLLMAIPGPILAQDFRYKGPSSDRDKLLVTSALKLRPVGKSQIGRMDDKVPEPRPIARFDNGWQWTYFNVNQLGVDKLQKALNPASPPTVFLIKDQPRSSGGRLSVTSVGALSDISAFDEHGRRSVTIHTGNGPKTILQSITLVAPDHLIVESKEVDWKFGISIKSIPFETLDKFLRHQISADDAQARYGLASFYIQANFYEEAFKELNAISRDFPEKKPAIDEFQAKLMNGFGREVLIRLNRRKRAGQHQLAESYARMLEQQPLSGAVAQDVKQYVKNYDESRQTIEKVKLLLGEWQAKLNNAELETRLQPMRSEINDQLDFETLPRLDSFLKAETDKDYKPADRLALAYSGWVLGAANAVPELDQALSVWDARQSVFEYVRTADPVKHTELIKKLQSTESISPGIVLQMIAQLPELMEPSNLEPGIAHRIETSGSDAVSYSVMLPMEYSPHHTYPLLIVLRPRGHTASDTLMVWAGGPGFPDHACQRGYIVISPEYISKEATEYTFGAAEQKSVLDCLIDARRRFTVDSDHVFLAGHGMGADAAFDVGMAHPDEFAGVIPLGGNCGPYCPLIWENATYTSWYVVGKGYDANDNRDPGNNVVFDKILLHAQKDKFDFMLVEYLGRNGETVIDEIPRFLDWMDMPVHARRPLPKQFKMKSLRRNDNRFFWLTAKSLPRDYQLPQPPDAPKPAAMEIDAMVTANGNAIHFAKAPTNSYVLRLTPDLVDFDKQFMVRIGGALKFTGFLTPDVGVLLEELRTRGDRTRLPLAVIQPGTTR